MATISSAAGLTGVTSIVDGDTIEIHGNAVRLHGIDAPESSQKCLEVTGELRMYGQKAALALGDLIDLATVRCRQHDTDRYDRTVASCEAHGVDLNACMVRQGYAGAYREYSTDYVDEEQASESQCRYLGRQIHHALGLAQWPTPGRRAYRIDAER